MIMSKYKFEITIVVVIILLIVLLAFVIEKGKANDTKYRQTVDKLNESVDKLEKKNEFLRQTISMQSALLDDSETMASQLIEQIEHETKRYAESKTGIEKVKANNTDWADCDCPYDVSKLCNEIIRGGSSSGNGITAGISSDAMQQAR